MQKILEGKISVVIPVKDSEYLLKRALESVFSQSVLPTEIIIVDDGSNPAIDTLGNIRSPEGVRIVLIRNDVSLGAAASRNIGVASASCPIVAFLDADDSMTAEYMSSLFDAWLKNERAVCIACGFYWCDQSLRPYRKHKTLPPINRESLLKLGNFVGGASVLSVNRRVFLNCGGFPLTPGSHDWGLLLRLAAAGTIYYIPEPLVRYQSPIFSSASLSRQYRRQILSLARIVKQEVSLEERPSTRTIHRALVVQHLITGGRYEMARRILKSMLVEKNLPWGQILKLLFAYSMGSKGYIKFQQYFAIFRRDFAKCLGS